LYHRRFWAYSDTENEREVLAQQEGWRRQQTQRGIKVKIDKLERALRRMPNKALVRFVKRCVCRILLGAANEAREELDLVYVECSRRGQERLYDTAYATVSRHPERCDIY
jgi:hypothetical protein